MVPNSFRRLLQQVPPMLAPILAEGMFPRFGVACTKGFVEGIVLDAAYEAQLVLLGVALPLPD